MELKHFFLWEDYSSTYKLSRTNPRPYLESMVEVVFTRGLKSLKYKNEFDEPEFIELNFLNSKVTKNNRLPGPRRQEKCNGIPADKKRKILKNLGGLFEKNRLQFWEQLPEC